MQNVNTIISFYHNNYDIWTNQTYCLILVLFTQFVIQAEVNVSRFISSSLILISRSECDVLLLNFVQSISIRIRVWICFIAELYNDKISKYLTFLLEKWCLLHHISDAYYYILHTNTIINQFIWDQRLGCFYFTTNITHLFVGGHDPLDGVGPGGQEVAGGGESLGPLAHQHLSLAVCCFCRRNVRQDGNIMFT